jgi:hypothetical protein
MKKVIIDQGEGYTVESHGNGVAYLITRERDGAERFIQGDDATLFRDEYDDLSKDQVIANTRASRFTWRELLDGMCGVYFD